MTEAITSAKKLEGSLENPEVEHRTRGVVIIPTFDMLIISGQGGLGKTTVANMIAGFDTDPRNTEAQAKYHLDGLPKPIQVGQLIRAEREATTGKPFIQDSDVPVEDDKKYDAEIRSIMENVRKPRLKVTNTGTKYELKDAAIIVEGRFQGFVGADVDEQMAGKKYSPITERVLIYTSDDKARLEAGAKREKKSGSGNLSTKKLIQLEKQRGKKLSKKAQELFPDIVDNQQIWDPEMLTKDGNLVYTIPIDALKENGTLKKPPEITREIYQQLYERGSIVVISKNSFADTPEGDSAFKTIKGLSRCQGLLEGNPCNRYGTRTLDVYAEDVLLVQIATCSNDHFRNVQHKIINESEEDFRFSRNGHPVKESINQNLSLEEQGRSKGLVVSGDEINRKTKNKTGKATTTRSGKSFGEPIADRANNKN